MTGKCPKGHPHHPHYTILENFLENGCDRDQYTKYLDGHNKMH